MYPGKVKHFFEISDADLEFIAQRSCRNLHAAQRLEL